jgi:hypothetical protein
MANRGIQTNPRANVASFRMERRHAAHLRAKAAPAKRHLIGRERSAVADMLLYNAATHGGVRYRCRRGRANPSMRQKNWHRIDRAQDLAVRCVVNPTSSADAVTRRGRGCRSYVMSQNRDAARSGQGRPPMLPTQAMPSQLARLPNSGGPNPCCILVPGSDGGASGRMTRMPNARLAFMLRCTM